MSNIFYRLHKRQQNGLQWACPAHHPSAAGVGMALHKAGTAAPRQAAARLEERLKKVMVLLLLSGCVPPPAQYSYYYHSYSGHYADNYTYAWAQGTLDRFCELPLVDINRILRSDPERAAKEVVCRRDSRNRAPINTAVNGFQAELAREVAKDVAQDVAKQTANTRGRYNRRNLNITRSEQVDDPHRFNANSPNTEGGSNVYIDVDHGHPE